MKKIQLLAAIPAVAGLLITCASPVQAAVGDTARTTGGGWFAPNYTIDNPPSETTPTDPGGTPGGEPPAEASLLPGGFDLLPMADNNLKATFGYVAACTEGETGPEYSCELSYHDHKMALRLHSLEVTGVSFNDLLPYATFEGLADVRWNDENKVRRFVVNVEDHGEPGREDFFQIFVYDTSTNALLYTAKGLLGGGNIQVHK
jgi:hypothetical protein